MVPLLEPEGLQLLEGLLWEVLGWTFARPVCLAPALPTAQGYGTSPRLRGIPTSCLRLWTEGYGSLTRLTWQLRLVLLSSRKKREMAWDDRLAVRLGRDPRPCY